MDSLNWINAKTALQETENTFPCSLKQTPFCFLCKLELLEFSVPLLHYIALNCLNPVVATLHRVVKTTYRARRLTTTKRLYPKFCTFHTVTFLQCETTKKETVTWIFMWLVALAVRVLLVPVEDAAHKGRYQSHLGFGAGHSLSE